MDPAAPVEQRLVARQGDGLGRAADLVVVVEVQLDCQEFLAGRAQGVGDDVVDPLEAGEDVDGWRARCRGRRFHAQERLEQCGQALFAVPLVGNAVGRAA
ncbi:hypothetical protein QFZ49_003521 [Streptomyces turgidiscabies]|uniref:Uncharacterized protein n=1 Tax=Streptomyces turgidiscabies TaxID=85558 RepID=A0ABU0RNK8_9ACTN|nr:hypothetical protein [Streptomyces turgidiscabies]